MPEQTLGGIPLGLGMVMKINFLNFHVHSIYHNSLFFYRCYKIVTQNVDNICLCENYLSREIYGYNV